MNLEIKIKKNRIKNGEVPEGYKKLKGSILPTNWNIIELGKYFDFKNGINFGSNETGFEIEVLGVGDFGSKFYADFNNLSKIQVNSTDNMQQIDHEDLLFVRSNGNKALVGRVLFVASIDREIYYSGFIIKGKCCNENIENEYIARFCSSVYVKAQFNSKGGGSNINNLNQVILSNLKIFLPEIDEQKRIVKILSTWDKAIELKERLIEEKKQHKKGLMKKLLTGEVRLSGFNGEWEKIILKSVLKSRNEKCEVSKELALYSLTIENGVTQKTDRYNREFLVKSNNKKYKLAKYDDIVYNPANLRYGAIAINKNEKSVLISPIYEVLYLKSEKKANIDFLSQLLTWERNIRYFGTKAEGTLVERMSVKIETFLSLSFYMPLDFEEQKEIANVLSCADNEIRLFNKELEALKLQKRGLMELLLTGIVRAPC